MNFSVFAHVTKETEITAKLQESEIGKICAFRTGNLLVRINSREKLLEIASLLENAAQKWDEEEK